MSTKRKGTTKHFYQLLYRFRSIKSIPIKPIKLITNLSVQSFPHYMDVSENSGTPKSSILIGFSIINHPFWGIPIFGNTHIGVERWIMSFHPCQADWIACCMCHCLHPMGYPESWRFGDFFCGNKTPKLVASQGRT